MSHVFVGDEVMVIFCSDIGLAILAKCERWHSDGTYDSAVPGFSQLYIIHGWYKGYMLPCAFILLTNKRETTYRRMLAELKEAALGLRLELRPKKVVTDFECAAMNAYEFHFPGVEVSGCYFHFAQSLYKKVVEVGKEYLMN